jgi:4-amino-4-deoxy-L-arabinose transferase-like glycosyltransferase
MTRRAFRAIADLWPQLAGLGLAIAALVVHVFLTLHGTRMDVTGPVLVLDHIFTIGVTAALLAVCIAVGIACLYRIGLSDLSAIDTLAYSAALGMGVVATAILILGSTVGFSSVGLWVLVGSLAALARRHVSSIPGLVGGALRGLADDAKISPLLSLPCYLLFLAAAMFLLVAAVAPPVDFDALMYHLHIPVQWLEHGAPFVPEDNLHAAQVGLMHMLYLPLISAGALAGPSVLSAILAMFLGLSVYSICRQVFGVISAVLALALLWGNAVILLVAVTPRLDVTLALFLLLAHGALVLALRRGEYAVAAIAMAGALLGLGFGVKYLALPYCLALVPTALLATRRASPELREVPKLFGVFLVSAFVASLPWMIKNVALFAAPLYPFLADRQLEPWIQTLYGSRRIPASVSTGSLEVLRQIRAPFNLVDFVFSPGRLTPEVEGRLYFASAAVLLAPLALLARNRMATAFALAGILYVATVLSVSTEINLRYLVPALPVMTIATAGALGTGPGRPTRARSLALLALVVLTLPAALYATRVRLAMTRAPDLAFGRISRNDYLLRNRNLLQWSYFQMVSQVNRRLPKDSKVLLLFEARGLYLEVPVIQDNLSVNWSLLVPFVDSSDCLRPTGATHVLVNTGILGYFVSRGLQPDMIRWSMFEEFSERCLEPLEGVPGFQLYRLRGPQQSRRSREGQGREGRHATR